MASFDHLFFLLNTIYCPFCGAGVRVRNRMRLLPSSSLYSNCFCLFFVFPVWRE